MYISFSVSFDNSAAAINGTVGQTNRMAGEAKVTEDQVQIMVENWAPS